MNDTERPDPCSLPAAQPAAAISGPTAAPAGPLPIRAAQEASAARGHPNHRHGAAARLPAPKGGPSPSAHPAPSVLPAAAILPTGHFTGRLRFNTLINGRTHVLPTWLVTGLDQRDAGRVATLLGGQPHVDDGQHELTYRVVTDDAEIEVILAGPQAVRLRMIRRHGNTVLRCCDGRTQRTPGGKRPCQCPPTIEGRWQAAKAGHGCEPLVHVAFRLAAEPTLGRFLLSSATWTFAEHAESVRGGLRRRRGPARAHLRIDRAIHTTAGGTTFAYTRPTIIILPGP
jgi:hypothetical protein